MRSNLMGEWCAGHPLYNKALIGGEGGGGIGVHIEYIWYIGG